MKRREFQIGLALAAGSALGWASGQKNGGQGEDAWADAEREAGGRLGVAVLDTGSGQLVGRRLDERFPMCSVFKWLLATAVLARVDEGSEHLERRIVFGRQALAGYSPVTQHHLDGRGLSVGELCDAAVTESDNTAANLLLESVGGPPAVTAIARRLGDPETRLDRNEPTLNEATPGDPRDTTTPRAMAQALQGAVLGPTLAPASREQLVRWLVANRTGSKRLRAGLPAGWRWGDKTGTGDRGTTNNAGVAWPPGRAPVVVVALLTECTAPGSRREAALARAGRIAGALVAAPVPRTKAL